MTDGTKDHACPQCGKAASGNFCQNCGASLGGRFCNQCGSKVSAGGKFCSECGARVVGGGAAAPPAAAPTTGSAAPPVRAGAAASAVGPSGQQVRGGRREAAVETVAGQNLAWWIAGAAMFALIVVVGLNMVRPGPAPGPTPTGASAATAGTGAPPDLSQMSPIEAADRLFNRVMQSVSQGDSAAAQQFLPMAIAAYNRARPLSLDGLYHVGMLNLTAGNFEAALDNGVEILGEDPNHLLGLSVAAQASIGLGELDAAAEYYQHIDDIYDEESQRQLEEYLGHTQIMVGLKQEAERFLEGR